VRLGVYRLTERGKAELDNFRQSIPPLPSPTKTVGTDEGGSQALAGGGATDDTIKDIDWRREFILLAHEMAKHNRTP
jgi:hypothetical protein